MWKIILLYFNYCCKKIAEDNDENDVGLVSTWVDNIMKWQAGQDAGLAVRIPFPTKVQARSGPALNDRFGVSAGEDGVLYYYGPFGEELEGQPFF